MIRGLKYLGISPGILLGIGITTLLFDNLNSIVQIALFADAEDRVTRVNQHGALAAVAFFLLVLVVIWLRSRRYIRPIFDRELKPASGKKELLLLVSHPAHAQHAIRYHYQEKKTLQKVWLIPTNDRQKEICGESSLGTAENIEKWCREELVTEQARPLQVEIVREGVDPLDAESTYETVRRLYRNSSFDRKDTVADFTGGLKQMSLGMIMATLMPDRDLEYVVYNSKTQQTHGPFLMNYRHEVFDLTASEAS